MSLSLDSVGKRVAYARKYRSLTQQELADRAGIAQSSLASLEAGRNKGTRNLVDLANALDVPADWLHSGQTGGKTVQEILLGQLLPNASSADQAIHGLLKQAVLGEDSSAYQQTATPAQNTAQAIGLKLLAWTARSLLDPDTAYKQHLEQQRRFQWAYPHSARAYLLRSPDHFYIPNLEEDDLLLIEPDAPITDRCNVVAVYANEEIIIGRVVDMPTGRCLVHAAEAGQEQYFPLDDEMKVMGVIAGRTQKSPRL
ncbi:hypothetical protein BWR15_15495 [Pseudomonas sp. T]|nr:hypothetical protein BWR15_15495 [Pseudomonas sp. T]